MPIRFFLRSFTGTSCKASLNSILACLSLSFRDASLPINASWSSFWAVVAVRKRWDIFYGSNNSCGLFWTLICSLVLALRLISSSSASSSASSTCSVPLQFFFGCSNGFLFLYRCRFSSGCTGISMAAAMAAGTAGSLDFKCCNRPQLRLQHLHRKQQLIYWCILNKLLLQFLLSVSTRSIPLSLIIQ